MKKKYKVKNKVEVKKPKLKSIKNKTIIKNKKREIIDSIILRGEKNLVLNNPVNKRKISHSEGINKHEKSTLEKISDIFSNYMVFSNPYKSKGYELCDFLAVLDNKIFIISDKGSASFNDVSVEDTNLIKRKWHTYYNSIKKSNLQLIEAKKWISENIKDGSFNVYNKDGDSEEDVVSFVLTKEPEFYLINTLSGLSVFCEKYFKDNNGSLILDKTQRQGKDKILSIDLKQKNEESYIHTLDEQGLKDLIVLVNTPTDFINYLNFRKDFIQECNVNKIRKENHILYFYAKKHLLNESLDFNYCDIVLNKNFENDKNDKLCQSLYLHDYIRNYVFYNPCSEIFDMIMVNFFYQGSYKNSGFDIEEPKESILRNEFYNVLKINRQERLAISLDILDNLGKKSKNDIYSLKIFGNMIIYIMNVKIKKNESLKEYRKRRVVLANLRASKISEKHNGNIFVLALDHPNHNILSHSEDLFCYLN